MIVDNSTVFVSFIMNVGRRSLRTRACILGLLLILSCIFILPCLSSTSFQAADVPCDPYPREIMSWTETVYQPVFSSLLPRSSEPFRLRENDYVIGEKKVAGNAQSIVKSRWIHHTSFLWSFTAANMEYLKVSKSSGRELG